MSLIADALKRAQSSKLARRYLGSEPSEVLSVARGVRRAERSAFFGSILSRVQPSLALWVGLGSGLVLFLAVFAYLFYGMEPKVKLPSSDSSAAPEKRAVELIVMEPLPVPAREPRVQKEEEVPAKAVQGQAPVEEGPPLEKASEERKIAKLEVPKVEREPSEQASAMETQKTSESHKVAVTSDLSEEVRDHFNLALFYQEERKFSLARREYEKAVQMWSLYAEAHNNLGVVYKELGMYEQAIAQLRKALALNPDYPTAYHNLGVIYQVKGDWKQATKSYERVLSLDRNRVSSYNNLGLVYRSQKRPHEARGVLEKALDINPSYPQTHYNLALVLEEIGELEQARFHYQKFMDLSGNENSRLVERIRVHLQGLVVKK